MTDSSGPKTPAGWYDDGSGRQRWWDGNAWSNYFADELPVAPASAPPVPFEATGAVAAPTVAGVPTGMVPPGSGDATLASAAVPAKKKHTVRNVVLIAAAAIVVLIIVVSVATAGSGGTKSASGSGVSTAAPAASATPTPTVNAYDKTYGTFTATTVTGTSDSVIPIPVGAKAGLITAKYTGSDNFIVTGLDAQNAQTTDVPVDTIGNYSGETTWGFDSIGNPATQLKVTASGPWTITLAPVSSAPASTPPSGAGDAVFLYNGGAATWGLTSDGAENFIVIQYSSSPLPNIAVDTIGAYSGSVPITGGPSVVTIKADGNWTIAP